MAVEKQAFTMNFAQGLDTKSDPKQIPPGNFLSLENAIFQTGKLLQKRNGFQQFAALSNATSLTTYQGSLIGLSESENLGESNLSIFNSGINSWIDKGTLNLSNLSVKSLIKNNLNQQTCDVSIANNGIGCVVFSQFDGTNTTYEYSIFDVSSGETIVAATPLVPTSGTVTGAPKVWNVGSYFIIVFPVTISAVLHLQYNAISTTSLIAGAPYDITSVFIYDSKGSFDGVVANGTLYLAYYASGTTLKITGIDRFLNQINTVTYTSITANIVSICADTTTPNPILYVNAANVSSSLIKTLAVDNNLNAIFAPFTSATVVTISNMASYASFGRQLVLIEIVNNYVYDSTIASHYIEKYYVTQSGTAGSLTTQMRGVGLASKPFQIDNASNAFTYVLAVYQSTYQNSFFLLQINNANTGIQTAIPVGTLANQEAGGYLSKGLPNATFVNGTISIPYLYKQMIVSVNKSQNATNSTAGIFSQLGINLVTYDFSSQSLTSEIGNNLHFTGSYMAAYDSSVITEQGFFVYPDSIKVTTATSGSGGITANTYYYVAVYEWSDAQGNIFKSAPSIPVKIITSSSTSTNTIYVPMLRTTLKTENPVKITLYRWSTSQQTYYEVTSITSPILNNPTQDYATITDILSDSSIIGNTILYTTGGVVENICPPAVKSLALFKSRLFAIDAENPNTLWYSKQVLQATPVEFSDLFTIYIPPTASSEISTGYITAIYPMDDKLVIFKEDAIYYIVGDGPDNTGANNNFSEPVFITANVGCLNPRSIVLTPNGLMFQSKKGIWLLGRDISTNYIGAPVEAFNNYEITSALNIPNTNQIRFTLAGTDTFLMYDTFYGQWGTFTNLRALNSVLYEGFQTFVDPYGRIFQETPNYYLDGSSPVTMQFTTGWINMAGLQGFQRAYFFYLLGTYFSPHTLNVSIAYDYNQGPLQTSTIRPINYSPSYGGDSLWGGGTFYGGNSNIAQNRVFLDIQKCQSIQISVQESFDASYGVPAGAGLNLSGVTFILGAKRLYPLTNVNQNVGSNS